MLNTKAMSLLFPGRAKPRPTELTDLQACLSRLLMEMGQISQVQESGLAQFLPLVTNHLNGMSDDEIRFGREVMRGIVDALDAADLAGMSPSKTLPWEPSDNVIDQHQTDTSGSGPTDAAHGSNGNGENFARA